MSFLKTEGKTAFFEPEDTSLKGVELREQYQDAQPFPHCVIDDFLPPHLLETCLENFPKELGRDGRQFVREQERFKRSFNPDYLDSSIRSIFYSFNSRPFLAFLENLTDIKGLIPDPYFIGGGFHETATGGHLSVHADFNHHQKLDLERRINVLVYLNKDWSTGYGGALELWDRKMQGCISSVVPKYNRCVIFNTDSTSFHGHPDPVCHPGDIPRRSIALYYYTATWSDLKRRHTTRFEPRPKSKDKKDWRNKIQEISDNYLPPFMSRFVKRLIRNLFK